MQHNFNLPVNIKILFVQGVPTGEKKGGLGKFSVLIY